jgi:uncharacterized membrane protein HdeD (DUF308 family)
MKAEDIKLDSGFVGIAVVDVGTLVRNWWVILLRGIAAIIFGLITFFAPEISLAVLVLVFGAYVFADGVLAIISAVRRRGESKRWWLLFLDGLAGVAAGVVTVIWPDITALALLYLIAAWALVTGGLEIAAAIRLRKVITGEWLLVLIGIASIALGVMLALFPGTGALAVVLWIGAYALASGILMIVLSFRLRSWGKNPGLRLVSVTA